MSSKQDPLFNTYQMLAQAVALCHAHGVRYVVLSPGSRSAPVALSFLRNEQIKHYIIPDERSAAYVALGIAKRTQSPVAIACTSGTAALNYAPAIAEACFSEVPLLIFTADRPAEWLGQADNQAIYQEQVYGRHVKASYSLPVELAHKDAYWYALRQINEACNTAMHGAKGPVHINIPLREPLYTQDHFIADSPLPFMHIAPGEAVPSPSIIAEAHAYKRIMIVAGMHAPAAKLHSSLQQLIANGQAVVVPDITANLHTLTGAINTADIICDTSTDEEKAALLPELVISLGGPIVSKGLKNLLRMPGIKAHWHIGYGPVVADTFQRLGRILPYEPSSFFDSLNGQPNKEQRDFTKIWQAKELSIIQKLVPELDKLGYDELKCAYHIAKHIPTASVLHIGNSLPIRFFTALACLLPDVALYSNRGTSGIDGSLSTAIGASLVDDRQHILVLGDLSFFYDRNGLWNNYLRPNIKIIVFNNHGGGIFRVLPGAAQQAELEEYFAVQQPLSVEHTVLQHNCQYYQAANEAELVSSFQQWLQEKDKPAILELEFSKPASLGGLKKRMGVG